MSSSDRNTLLSLTALCMMSTVAVVGFAVWMHAVYQRKPDEDWCIRMGQTTDLPFPWVIDSVQRVGAACGAE